MAKPWPPKMKRDAPAPRSTEQDTKRVHCVGVARLKKRRVAYQNSSPRIADADTIATYNTILKNEGKQAADTWLNELWA